jgi:hypothetical protein
MWPAHRGPVTDLGLSLKLNGPLHQQAGNCICYIRILGLHIVHVATYGLLTTTCEWQTKSYMLITHTLHTDYMRIHPRISCYIPTYQLHILHSSYMRVTYRLHTDYIQITYRLQTDYIQITYATYGLHTDYIRIKYRLYTDYIQIAYALLTGCIQIIYRLHTD